MQVLKRILAKCSQKINKGDLMKKQNIILVLLITVVMCLALLLKLSVVAYAGTLKEAECHMLINDADTSVCERITYMEEKSDEKTTITLVTDMGKEELTLKEYLTAVVMSEIPYTYEPEAIKAQTVAARTYTLKLLSDHNRHGTNSVCDSAAHCSAYLDRDAFISMYGEEAYDLAYSAASAAVDATDGEVITYGGELCTAVYHASSFGTTESSYNLWGTYTPYLISVTTPEKTEPVSTTIDKTSFENYAYSLGADRFHNINVNKNDSGRCDVVSVGGVRIPASKIRSHFGLKSCYFDVSMNADNIVFTAYGYGHGVGMSQEGANTMAKEGSTYKEILCHYYTGVKIETVI